MYRQDNAEMWWGEDKKVDEVDPKRWSRSWRRFTSKANKRGQIKIFILLNRAFVYYCADFYFCYEQVVIAAMSAALALVKKKKKKKFIYSTKKKNVLYSCYTQVLSLDFYWKFSKNIYPEHWLENFFCAMHLICLLLFPKEYSSTFCDCHWYN